MEITVNSEVVLKMISEVNLKLNEEYDKTFLSYQNYYCNKRNNSWYVKLFKLKLKSPEDYTDKTLENIIYSKIFHKIVEFKKITTSIKTIALLNDKITISHSVITFFESFYSNLEFENLCKQLVKKDFLPKTKEPTFVRKVEID